MSEQAKDGLWVLAQALMLVAGLLLHSPTWVLLLVALTLGGRIERWLWVHGEDDPCIGELP